MPRLNDLKTNFTSGELDPKLVGRTDIKHYYNGGDRLRNVFVIPQGGVRRRPGTVYIGDVPLASGGGLSRTRLIPFQFSTEEHYLFVIFDGGAHVYKNGVLVANDIVLPYASSDLRPEYEADGVTLVHSGITWTQNLDTLLLFHEDYPTKQIQRQGDDSAWAVSDWPYKNIPQFKFGDTPSNGTDEVQQLVFTNPSGGAWTANDIFTLILEDENTENIEWVADDATLATAMQTALRNLPNTGAAGITVSAAGSETFTVTFSGDDGHRPWGDLGFTVESSSEAPAISVTVTTPGVFDGEDVWSATKGYPRCGVFYQGRLLVGGSKSRPQTFWASRAGDPTDFNNKRTADDYGIDVTADTDDVSAIFAIFPGRHLQFFTSSGEFYDPSSEVDPITPNTVVMRRTSNRGAVPGLPVFSVDGATLFIQRRGEALREFIFTDVEQAYQANSLSLLSSHLLRNPLAWAVRRSTSTDDADYVLLANPDGTLTSFCTLRTQEVNAFTLNETDGKFKDVAVDLDDIYVVVERIEDDGVTAVRTLERMVEGIPVDGGSQKRNLDTPEIDVSSKPLPQWMVGRTVDIVLDGMVQPQQVVPLTGFLTFARPAVSSWAVGLPWPDVSDDGKFRSWMARTMPVAENLSDGPITGKKKRVVEATVEVFETTGLLVNDDRVAFRNVGGSLLDQALVPFTGAVEVEGLLGWAEHGQLTFGDNAPTMATVLSAAYKVAV
jgi:hypothetical protein